MNYKLVTKLFISVSIISTTLMFGANQSPEKVFYTIDPTKFDPEIRCHFMIKDLLSKRPGSDENDKIKKFLQELTAGQVMDREEREMIAVKVLTYNFLAQEEVEQFLPVSLADTVMECFRDPQDFEDPEIMAQKQREWASAPALWFPSGWIDYMGGMWLD
jgi:hypothetical protein